jgi:hypothetical protein
MEIHDLRIPVERYGRQGSTTGVGLREIADATNLHLRRAFCGEAS